MEIVIAVIVIGLLGYWAYTNFNKEKPDESHVLDTFTKPAEVVPPAPIAEPAPVAEPVRVEAVAPVVKKPRVPAKPRAKKPPAV
jgi:hypothetical protein